MIKCKNLLVIITYLFSTTLYCQTIYVSPSGDDFSDGSQGNPVKSFQKEADLATKDQGVLRVEFSGGLYPFDATVVLDVDYNGRTWLISQRLYCAFAMPKISP